MDLGEGQVVQWYKEIEDYYNEIENLGEGEHLIDRYKRVVAIMIRVSHIRSGIAYSEVIGEATPLEKKFRTMVLDPFIERLESIARFESRGISAKQIEAQMER